MATVYGPGRVVCCREDGIVAVELSCSNGKPYQGFFQPDMLRPVSAFAPGCCAVPIGQHVASKSFDPASAAAPCTGMEMDHNTVAATSMSMFATENAAVAKRTWIGGRHGEAMHVEPIPDAQAAAKRQRYY